MLYNNFYYAGDSVVHEFFEIIAIMDNDHSEVGGTGCKSLLPALSRSNLEDGGDDEDIRDEDQNHGHHNDE